MPTRRPRFTLRLAAWLAVLALLVNLAGHVRYGAALAAVEPEQPGAVLVICTPDGMKRVAWTPEGFVPLPDEPGQSKEPCPLCSPLAGGLLLPEAPTLDVPTALLLARGSWAHLPQPCSSAAYATPPVRAPPLLA